MDDLPRGVQRLVAHLGLSHGPARAAVAGLLWPDVPESQASGTAMLEPRFSPGSGR